MINAYLKLPITIISLFKKNILMQNIYIFNNVSYHIISWHCLYQWAYIINAIKQLTQIDTFHMIWKKPFCYCVGVSAFDIQMHFNDFNVFQVWVERMREMNVESNPINLQSRISYQHEQSAHSFTWLTWLLYSRSLVLYCLRVNTTSIHPLLLTFVFCMHIHSPLCVGLV